MSSTITVRGFVATQPKFVIVNGLNISSFRLGSSERRYNRATASWENGPTSWYSVSCFRELATNAFASVNKGDPVIVTGRLKVSEWSAGDKSGLDVEIEAEGIGHDFRWGKAVGFAKNNGKPSGGRDDGAGAPEEEQAPPDEQAAGAEPAWSAPGMALGSASVVDAGQPTSFDLVELDDETGEVVDAAAAGTPPF
jgi:single-strand DNA-binding protein